MCWNMSVIPTHDIAQQHGTGMKDTLKCVQCDAHIRACLHPQCFPRDCSGASVLACAWIRLLMLHAYMDVNARWCVSSFLGDAVSTSRQCTQAACSCVSLDVDVDAVMDMSW